MPRPTYARLTAACTTVLLLGACGSSGPKDIASSADLMPGACQQAAPAINSLHRTVARLRDDPDKTSGTGAALGKGQADLTAARPAGVGDEVAVQMDNVVDAVGYLRLGIQLHSADGAALRRVDDAARQLVTACRPA